MLSSPRDEVRQRLLAATARAASDSAMPRLLVVVAHPDDEVLALGGRLERLRHSRVITITDGAPANGDDARHHGFSSLESYRAARHAELVCAFAHAKVDPQVIAEFRAAVADQTASLHLSALAQALKEQIAEFAPEAVLTHPYEGGHPDHDACAFAVHAAMRLALHEGALAEAPLLLEAPFYHAGGNGSMETGSFLPHAPASEMVTYELDAEERANKQFRIDCFRSQAETLAQFRLNSEMFRVAPAYDFTRRPHEGQLFYERFPWGMDGERFCRLAEEAMHELFDEPRSGARRGSLSVAAV